MGWGSSHAQLITSSPGGVSAAPSTQKSGSAAKNKKATEELLDIVSNWSCLLGDGEEEEGKDVRRLLAQGADINAADESGTTVLMHAAGRWGPIKLLLDYGADINAANKEGYTALMEAVTGCVGKGEGITMGGMVDFVRIEDVRLLLEKGANPKAVAKDGKTALSLAQGDKRLTRVVKAAIANYGSGKKLDLSSVFNAEAAFMQAVEKGDAAAVQRLLEKDADADTDRALSLAVEHGRTKVVELLLKRGVDVNGVVRDDAPWSLLGYAARKGYAEIVRLLINAGADVNDWPCGGRFCPWGETVLSVSKDYHEIVRMLKAAGAKEKPAGD